MKKKHISQCTQSNLSIIIIPSKQADMIVRDSYGEVFCGIAYDKSLSMPIITFIGEGKSEVELFCDNRIDIYNAVDDTLSLLLMEFGEVGADVPNFFPLLFAYMPEASPAVAVALIVPPSATKLTSLLKLTFELVPQLQMP